MINNTNAHREPHYCRHSQAAGEHAEFAKKREKYDGGHSIYYILYITRCITLPNARDNVRQFARGLPTVVGTAKRARYVLRTVVQHEPTNISVRFYRCIYIYIVADQYVSRYIVTIFFLLKRNTVKLYISGAGARTRVCVCVRKSLQ